MCSLANLPGNKVPADIEEDEEALVVGREGSVGAQTPPLLPQTLQIDHVQVDLLSDGRGIHGIRDHTARRPGPAVHVKVPDEGIMQRKEEKLKLGSCVQMSHVNIIYICSSEQ